MKIAIMGSGGIGGYYGGRLAKAGEDVTFIARGPHLEALRTKGLRVESHFGNFELASVRATEHPADVGEAELVIAAIKTYALEEAARAMQPMVGGNTTILPLLNGVDIAERIGAVVGMERVLGGLCGVSSFIAEPGVIHQVTPFEFVKLGELSGEDTPRARAIESVLKGAEINVEWTARIEVELWNKFIMLTALAGICALTRQVPVAVRSDSDTRNMLEECVKEIETLGRGKGVELAPDVAVKTMAMIDGFPEQAKPSMLLDLERGKPLELEALNGTVSRMGKEIGVKTPINDFIHAALKLQADGAS